ncbi:hypothetical protein CNYM01_13429 [Colletotrichum nymphaeae SA-01]|uniref:Uncharacterized protein n=1 Tax=Colletotrichum nymphaeae SA-01 TaxID=1460502 RepID=A0A135RV52_9PEZI|nr:hypothetical protein CNYM01_13429 [Colletotrichum nymphaeae SA-01]
MQRPAALGAQAERMLLDSWAGHSLKCFSNGGQWTLGRNLSRPAGHGKQQDDIGSLPVRGFAANGSRPGQAWPSCGPVTQGTSVDEPPGGGSPGERHLLGSTATSPGGGRHQNPRLAEPPSLILAWHAQFPKDPSEAFGSMPKLDDRGQPGGTTCIFKDPEKTDIGNKPWWAAWGRRLLDRQK